MFVFNPEGKRTILSIDGGGMRGVISLAILAYLEEQTGKPSHELFDMVAGTSTGAIIAAGIALKLPARYLLDEVYKVRLPQAFGSLSRLRFYWDYLARGLRYFYPIEPFLKALESFPQDSLLQDLGDPASAGHPYRKPIILLTAKDMRTSNTYYLTNEGPGAQLFGRWPVKGAVAASGSAPIYFPPVLGNLIDGGVGTKGNPCLAASVEAIEYIGFKEEETLHISLGTGHIPSDTADKQAAGFNLFNWLPYMIVAAIDDSATEQVFSNRAIYKKMDLRRYNPSLVPERLRDELGIDTGRINTLSLSLDSRSPDELNLMEEIGRRYAELLDWNAPNRMPWETQGGQVKPTIRNVDWAGSIFS